MSAHVRSLVVLRHNVHTQARAVRDAAEAGMPALVTARLDVLLDQLDADVREVRADVDALIDGGEW